MNNAAIAMEGVFKDVTNISETTPVMVTKTFFISLVFVYLFQIFFHPECLYIIVLHYLLFDIWNIFFFT